MAMLLVDNPWLVLCGLIAGVIVTCTAIIFITDYLRTSHQAQIDASLKEDMLELGMSAADIKTVLEARSDGEAARMALCGNQGVRVGLGKFQVEVGGVEKSASTTPVSPAANG